MAVALIQENILFSTIIWEQLSQFLQHMVAVSTYM